MSPENQDILKKKRQFLLHLFTNCKLDLAYTVFPMYGFRYIRSLSRCFTWLASGGKSGSTFCKTQGASFCIKKTCNCSSATVAEHYQGPHNFRIYLVYTHFVRIWQAILIRYHFNCRFILMTSLCVLPTNDRIECFLPADDRFILKQMSRFEVQSFVEFAPHYFQYITKAHNEQVRVRVCGNKRTMNRYSTQRCSQVKIGTLAEILLTVEQLFLVLK